MDKKIIKKIVKRSRLKRSLSLIIFSLFINSLLSAQPSLNLSVSQLLNWQPTPLTSQNISNEPLSHRTVFPNLQIISVSDTNAKILYCPDGMNTFGSYIDSAMKFNLFNFSHWQYIDILAWFGGSASEPIAIPAKSWVDAAHKNGVKVIATVFMPPNVYGGSQSLMQSFLQQDISGNFIAAAKLIQIADYYNFDGWFLNFETSVNSYTGALASSFVNKFDSAYAGEVIWYDAMLQNGSISYQNCLNASNAYFFSHSTGLFTNYDWSSASTVSGSHSYATALGLSPYRVYTGADMWPGRPAQTAFSNYNWIDMIISNGIAKTSVALFATNFTFNYAPFSNFVNDSTDYNDFYITERKIFSGIDQDPFTTDLTWKGIGYYVPVRTALTSFPFHTDFNTGHGLNYYDGGNVFVAGSWSNISHQSPLPSWTFYANGVSIGYDFTAAYSGGSSLKVSGTTPGTYTIPLYSTCMITGGNLLNMEMALRSNSPGIDSVSLLLKRKNSSFPLVCTFHPAVNGNWEDLLHPNLSAGFSDTVVAIILKIYSSSAFTMNIGKIDIEVNSITTVQDGREVIKSLLVYPNPSDGEVNFNNKTGSDGKLSILELNGKLIYSGMIRTGETRQLTFPGRQVYTYEFYNGKEQDQGKFIVF